LIYEQSAVVPYRHNKDGVLEILFVTSSGGSRWVIPKGLIEPDMTPWDSAANEAYEEAGLVGKAEPTELGVYEYSKWSGTCRVRVYPMRVDRELDVYPEAHMRKREWVQAEAAPDRVDEPGLKEILKGAVERFGQA